MIDKSVIVAQARKAWEEKPERSQAELNQLVANYGPIEKQIFKANFKAFGTRKANNTLYKVLDDMEEIIAFLNSAESSVLAGFELTAIKTDLHTKAIQIVRGLRDETVEDNADVLRDALTLLGKTYQEMLDYLADKDRRAAYHKAKKANA